MSRLSASRRTMTFNRVCALQHRLVTILVQTLSSPLHCLHSGDLYIWKKGALMETRILVSLMCLISPSTASSSPLTRLIGDYARFLGQTGGLAAVAGARPLPEIIVPLLAGVEGASSGSVHTTLTEGYQKEQDPYAVRCTKSARWR